MILCHKCSGVLASEESENISGLYGCCCISGYVRGFEKPVNRLEAITAQVKEQDDRIRLAIGQKQPQSSIDRYIERKKQLLSLES